MKNTRGNPSVLSMYSIYERPKDFPEGYVIRRFEIRPDSDKPVPCEAAYGETLESVRAQVPPGLVKLPRHGDDEPQIVETWV